MAVDQELTREQKLASVRFNQVKDVYISELVAVRDERIPFTEAVPLQRGLHLDPANVDLLLKCNRPVNPGRREPSG